MFENTYQVDSSSRSIQSLFFDLTHGSSTDGLDSDVYDMSLRDVNIYRRNADGDKVAQNIKQCIEELIITSDSTAEKTLHDQSKDTINVFMTSNYAKNGVKIFVGENKSEVSMLTAATQAESFYQDLITSNMHEHFTKYHIKTIKADAIILKCDQVIGIGVIGASADAHTIHIIDDTNRRGAFVSGAHASIRAGVIEKTLERMFILGTEPEQVKIIIGPGLGPYSYEFGQNAPEYFGVDGSEVIPFLESVQDQNGQPKFLIDFHNLVVNRAQKHGIEPRQVLNVNINNMGYNLYQRTENGLERRKTLTPEESQIDNFLFASARRHGMFSSTDATGSSSVDLNHKPDVSLHNNTSRSASGMYFAPISAIYSDEDAFKGRDLENDDSVSMVSDPSF